MDLLDPDPATGRPRLILQYHRARYDDVKNARWRQRDPSGYADGANLYESFGGNPSRLRDPMGEGVFDDLIDLYYRYGTPEGVKQTLDERMGVKPLDPVTQAARDREAIILGNLGPPAAQITEAARQVAVRGTGVAGAVGGAAEAAIGVVLFFPSLGTSSVFVVHGADVAQAGFRQTATGEWTATFTYEIMAESGHPTAAWVVDVGTSLAGGGAGWLASTRAAPELLRGTAVAGVLPEGAAWRLFPGTTGVSPPPRVWPAGVESPVRAWITANIAESQAARAASDFLVSAAREARLLQLRRISVATPHGAAVQEISREALLLRAHVSSGHLLLRGGNFPRSAAQGAQFFSVENPLSPGFAERLGAANLSAGPPQFIIGGRLRPGGAFVTRQTPAFGSNPGGALEIVVEPTAVELEFFVMP